MNRHTLLVANTREAARFPDAMALAVSPHLEAEALLLVLRRAGVKKVGATSAALADERGEIFVITKEKSGPAVVFSLGIPQETAGAAPLCALPAVAARSTVND